MSQDKSALSIPAQTEQPTTISIRIIERRDQRVKNAVYALAAPKNSLIGGVK
ncbi:MAG: hypothetical protein WCG16_11915 [Methylococcales bacterium]